MDYLGGNTFKDGTGRTVFVDKTIQVVIGDGVANIVPGLALSISRLPALTLIGWTLVGDATGSIVIDLKKATYADFPTTTSITASAKPTLSSARKNTSTTLAGWTTTAAAGDVLDVVVDSASGLKKVTLALHFRST